MRAIVAIVLALSVLFLGYHAVGMQAELADDSLSDNNTSAEANESYNVSRDVFEGLARTGSTAVPWFGIGAVILIALGILVAASGGGR